MKISHCNDMLVRRECGDVMYEYLSLSANLASDMNSPGASVDVRPTNVDSGRRGEQEPVSAGSSERRSSCLSAAERSIHLSSLCLCHAEPVRVGRVTLSCGLRETYGRRIRLEQTGWCHITRFAHLRKINGSGHKDLVTHGSTIC